MRRQLSILLLLLACMMAAGCTKKIQVQAIQLSNFDGSNLAPITRDEVKIWMDAANSTYGKYDYEFVYDNAANSPDFVTWNNSTLNKTPATDEEQANYDILANFMAVAWYPDRMVVYFRAEGGGGWSWGPTGLHYVSMPSYTNTSINKPSAGSPNDTLFAHEAGHYLGLPHTFTDVQCNVATLNNTDGDKDGQDGNTTEDDIKDTAGDPNACAPTTSLNCPGGTVVVNSVTFSPPWTNIMTYHDCLPETISLDQRKVFERTLKDSYRSPILR
jgi:hypothetical protein